MADHLLRYYLINVPKLIRYNNSFALARTRRFGNPILRRLLFHLGYQPVVLFGQRVGLRPEAKVMFAVSLLHTVQFISQKVLAGYLNALWELVYLLVFVEADEKLRLQGRASPEECPCARSVFRHTGLIQGVADERQIC